MPAINTPDGIRAVNKAKPVDPGGVERYSFNLVAWSNWFKTPEHNAVRFIVHPEVKARAPQAMAWVKEFLSRLDTSLLDWLRIDFGREHRDRQGRIYYKFHGVYGRCSTALR